MDRYCIDIDEGQACISPGPSSQMPFCGNGQLCFNSICYRACSDNGYCTGGRVCVDYGNENRICSVGCELHRDCNLGEACIDSVCSVIVDGRDCLAGDVCGNGTSCALTQSAGQHAALTQTAQKAGYALTMAMRCWYAQTGAQQMHSAVLERSA